MGAAEINLLEILQEASKSPLGIIALVILTMSVVGVILFRNSEDKYKFGVFSILLIGIVSFTYASLQIVQPTPEEVYDVASLPKKVDSDTLPESSLLEGSEELPAANQDSENQQDLAKSTSLSDRNEGFIYLGTYRNGNWSDPNGTDLSVTC